MPFLRDMNVFKLGYRQTAASAVPRPHRLNDAQASGHN
jgi:hypothetical protein